MTERDKLLGVMRPVCDGIRSFDNAGLRQQFLESITSAAEDYLALPDPVKVASEIRNLEAKLRKGSEEPRALLDDLSPGTVELIEAHGEIPNFSVLSDPEEIVDASRDLLGIVTNSSKIIEQKSQNRTKHVALGQQPHGRQRHLREEFFVSRLAAAFATATGEPTARAWSDCYSKDFEVVVELAFDALKVNESISTTKLIERHIRNRDNPK